MLLHIRFASSAPAILFLICFFSQICSCYTVSYSFLITNLLLLYCFHMQLLSTNLLLLCCYTFASSQKFVPAILFIYSLLIKKSAPAMLLHIRFLSKICSCYIHSFAASNAFSKSFCTSEILCTKPYTLNPNNTKP